MAAPPRVRVSLPALVRSTVDALYESLRDAQRDGALRPAALDFAAQAIQEDESVRNTLLQAAAVRREALAAWADRAVVVLTQLHAAVHMCTQHAAEAGGAQGDTTLQALMRVQKTLDEVAAVDSVYHTAFSELSRVPDVMASGFRPRFDELTPLVTAVYGAPFHLVPTSVFDTIPVPSKQPPPDASPLAHPLLEAATHTHALAHVLSAAAPADARVIVVSSDDVTPLDAAPRAGVSLVMWKGTARAHVHGRVVLTLRALPLPAASPVRLVWRAVRVEIVRAAAPLRDGPSELQLHRLTRTLDGMCVAAAQQPATSDTAPWEAIRFLCAVVEAAVATSLITQVQALASQEVRVERMDVSRRSAKEPHVMLRVRRAGAWADGRVRCWHTHEGRSATLSLWHFGRVPVSPCAPPWEPHRFLRVVKSTARPDGTLTLVELETHAGHVQLAVPQRSQPFVALAANDHVPGVVGAAPRGRMLPLQTAAPLVASALQIARCSVHDTLGNVSTCDSAAIDDVLRTVWNAGGTGLYPLQQINRTVGSDFAGTSNAVTDDARTLYQFDAAQETYVKTDGSAVTGAALAAALETARAVCASLPVEVQRLVMQEYAGYSRVHTQAEAVVNDATPVVRVVVHGLDPSSGRARVAGSMPAPPTAACVVEAYVRPTHATGAETSAALHGLVTLCIDSTLQSLGARLDYDTVRTLSLSIPAAMAMEATSRVLHAHALASQARTGAETAGSSSVAGVDTAALLGAVRDEGAWLSRIEAQLLASPWMMLQHLLSSTVCGAHASYVHAPGGQGCVFGMPGLQAGDSASLRPSDAALVLIRVTDAAIESRNRALAERVIGSVRDVLRGSVESTASAGGAVADDDALAAVRTRVNPSVNTEPRSLGGLQGFLLPFSSSAGAAPVPGAAFDLDADELLRTTARDAASVVSQLVHDVTCARPDIRRLLQESGYTLRVEGGSLHAVCDVGPSFMVQWDDASGVPGLFETHAAATSPHKQCLELYTERMQVLFRERVSSLSAHLASVAIEQQQLLVQAALTEVRPLLNERASGTSSTKSVASAPVQTARSFTDGLLEVASHACPPGTLDVIDARRAMHQVSTSVAGPSHASADWLDSLEEPAGARSAAELPAAAPASAVQDLLAAVPIAATSIHLPVLPSLCRALMFAHDVDLLCILASPSSVGWSAVSRSTLRNQLLESVSEPHLCSAALQAHASSVLGGALDVAACCRVLRRFDRVVPAAVATAAHAALGKAESGTSANVSLTTISAMLAKAWTAAAVVIAEEVAQVCWSLRRSAQAVSLRTTWFSESLRHVVPSTLVLSDASLLLRATRRPAVAGMKRGREGDASTLALSVAPAECQWQPTLGHPVFSPDCIYKNVAELLDGALHAVAVRDVVDVVDAAGVVSATCVEHLVLSSLLPGATECRMLRGQLPVDAGKRATWQRMNAADITTLGTATSTVPECPVAWLPSPAAATVFGSLLQPGSAGPREAGMAVLPEAAPAEPYIACVEMAWSEVRPPSVADILALAVAAGNTVDNGASHRFAELVAAWRRSNGAIAAAATAAAAAGAAALVLLEPSASSPLWPSSGGVATRTLADIGFHRPHGLRIPVLFLHGSAAASIRSGLGATDSAAARMRAQAGDPGVMAARRARMQLVPPRTAAAQVVHATVQCGVRPLSVANRGDADDLPTVVVSWLKDRLG